MMQRIRIKYAKTQPLKYTGSLDMQKVWERTLRRCHITLAYSQGFHPQPRIQQANPLPLGVLSQAEIVDFWLEEDKDVHLLRETLVKHLPPGIELLDLTNIPIYAPAMQTQVTEAEYSVSIPSDQSEGLADRIIWLMNLTTLPRERRGKQYDLRPLIINLQLVTNSISGTSLLMRLACREGATGRPDEVLTALGLNPAHLSILRTALITTE